MSYFKRPRTTNEKRLYAQTVYNEIGIKIRIRGRRKPKNLPDAWDDINRSKPLRSWKKHRKSQWYERKKEPDNLSGSSSLLKILMIYM